MVQHNDIPTYSTLSDSLSSYHGLKIGCMNIRGLLGNIDESLMDSMLLRETEIVTEGEFYYISRKVFSMIKKV